MSPGQLATYQQLQRRRAPGAAAPGVAWVLHNERLSGEQVRLLLWHTLYSPKGGRGPRAGISLPPVFACVQEILQSKRASTGSESPGIQLHDVASTPQYFHTRLHMDSAKSSPIYMSLALRLYRSGARRHYIV